MAKKINRLASSRAFIKKIQLENEDYVDLEFDHEDDIVLDNRELQRMGIGSKISQETWGTTPAPQDTSLGQLTVDVNAHKSGTTRHGSLVKQTTKGIHRLVKDFY
ncbi:hypothetical protein J3Q64DRAFT_1838242 [Phycomyces blakesleeanus]|uniref:Uncharacterized protein n=1 Tax=Phycomyces blakesleeanus TaxID=4837 RepID=A0ABR3ASP8_PHYBL